MDVKMRVALDLVETKYGDEPLSPFARLNSNIGGDSNVICALLQVRKRFKGFSMDETMQQCKKVFSQFDEIDFSEVSLLDSGFIMEQLLGQELSDLYESNEGSHDIPSFICPCK